MPASYWRSILTSSVCPSATSISIFADGVAVFTLNAPEKLNALSLDELNELDAAYGLAEAADVRALMISRSCWATAAKIWTVSLFACGLSTAPFYTLWFLV